MIVKYGNQRRSKVGSRLSIPLLIHSPHSALRFLVLAPFFKAFGDLGFVAFLGGMVELTPNQVIGQILLFYPMTIEGMRVTITLTVPKTFSITGAIHQMDRDPARAFTP